MSIIVDKLHTLHGEPVAITADGLKPFSLYEIKLLMKHYSGTFRSYGIFKADETGRIDVEQQAPVRGTYTGVRSMGLFESLEPLADFREGGYTDWISPEPWRYELILSTVTGEVVDRIELTKNYKNPSVERIVVEEGRVRGTIFKPKGEGPFPTILDMTGSGGGLREHRAASLASEGFCVLALAFFCYKDLPGKMTEVDVEYFMEAVDILTNLPFASKRIALQGNSFGGALVLLLPKYCPQVVSVVTINPPHLLSNVAHVRHKGEPLPFAMANFDDFIWVNRRYLIYDRAVKMMEGSDEIDLQPELAAGDTSFRFVVSLDDQTTSSLFTARYYSDRLLKSGHYVEVQAVPGGHLMEPPYFPHHGACYSKFSDTFMAYGGEASLHGIHQTPVWTATVDFFRRTLTPLHQIQSSKL